jgi:hypothetical protein
MEVTDDKNKKAGNTGGGYRPQVEDIRPTAMATVLTFQSSKIIITCTRPILNDGCFNQSNAIAAMQIQDIS